MTSPGFARRKQLRRELSLQPKPHFPRTESSECDPGDTGKEPGRGRWLGKVDLLKRAPGKRKEQGVSRVEKINFILFSEGRRQLLSPERRKWVEREYSTDNVYLEKVWGLKTAHGCQKNRTDGVCP